MRQWLSHFKLGHFKPFIFLHDFLQNFLCYLLLKPTLCQLVSLTLQDDISQPLELGCLYASDSLLTIHTKTCNTLLIFTGSYNATQGNFTVVMEKTFIVYTSNSIIPEDSDGAKQGFVGRKKYPDQDSICFNWFWVFLNWFEHFKVSCHFLDFLNSFIL